MPMATKLGRMVTDLEGLLHIKSHDTMITVLLRSFHKLNHYISSAIVPRATKLGRMVAYRKEPLPLKVK